MAITVDVEATNFILGWLHKVQVFFQTSPLVRHESLEDIILAQAVDFTSPRTGGTLHKVTKEQATEIAALITKYAPRYRLEPAQVLAGLQGESRCDPNAINPNHQDGQPGETAYATWLHTDMGIAQFDGRVLQAAQGCFADLKGLTYQQITEKAFDPEWAIPHFCAHVDELLEDAQRYCINHPLVLKGVPDGNFQILAYEGYNAGEQGAALIALNQGTKGGWSYGKNWAALYTQYDKNLKGM